MNENDWKYPLLRVWNDYLTYEQNNANGANLPEENYPVLIYNYDRNRYYVGTFMQSCGKLGLYNAYNGKEMSLNYVMWSYFELADVGD